MAAGVLSRPLVLPPTEWGGDQRGGEPSLPVRCARGVVLIVLDDVGSDRGDDAEGVGQILAQQLAPVGIATESLRVAGEHIAQDVADVECVAQAIEARAEAIRGDLARSGGRVACYATGVAAAGALCVAARRPALFAALALRSVAFGCLGRSLRQVRVPTLLLVGAYEQPAVDFHRLAAVEMATRAALCVLPRATRSLSEPGTRYAAAHAVTAWLAEHLWTGRRERVLALWSARALYRSLVRGYAAWRRDIRRVLAGPAGAGATAGTCCASDHQEPAARKPTSRRLRARLSRRRRAGMTPTTTPR